MHVKHSAFIISDSLRKTTASKLLSKVLYPVKDSRLRFINYNVNNAWSSSIFGINTCRLTVVFPL
jgi:hypothetical protein